MTEKYLRPWHEIYRDRMNTHYFEHVKSKYGPFIHAIKGITAPWYVELGCGTGNITRALIEGIDTSEHKFVAIEKCSHMVDLAISNLPTSVLISREDIFRVCGWRFQREGDAVVHSHGVLEHFNDDQIRSLILLNSKCKQVHYVPSAMYDEPSRGDERLMTPTQWKSILSEIEGLRFNISEFNGGYDLIIRTEPLNG